MGKRHGKLKDLNAALGTGRFDCFIGSTSYEERCLSVPQHLDLSRVGVAVIGVNVTYQDAIAANLNAMRTLLGDKLKELQLVADDPITSFDNIARVLEPILAQSTRLIVDVTTFTRESLLLVLGYLRGKLKGTDTIEFVYSHAKDYSVGDPPEKKWLSKGIREIRSVLGFPGRMVPSKRTHMLVLVGFEDDRAFELIRETEPSFVSLGVGDSSEEGTIPHQATNLHRFSRLRSVLGHVDEFTFKAYDAEASRDALKTQMHLHPDCNVVVAPMNTKISTIGALLLAFEDDSVQLCYAPANIYNVAKYSLPDDDFYLFTLPGFPK